MKAYNQWEKTNRGELLAGFAEAFPETYQEYAKTIWQDYQRSGEHETGTD